MPLAERSIDGSGGTLYRRQDVASMPPGRNAMPLAERNNDGSGGTLYRRQDVASVARAERYATGTGSCRVSCGWPLVLSSMR